MMGTKSTPETSDLNHPKAALSHRHFTQPCRCESLKTFTQILKRAATCGQRLAMGWTVRVSNSGGVEIFLARPDRPWGAPSLLHSGYRVSLPGVKRPGRGGDHPPQKAPRLKKNYFYFPSGPSWHLLGRALYEF
jgi:hypothetical protein